MNSSKDLIIKDSLIYSASSYISIFMGFFISILAKRFLGVVGAGYWALFMIIETYGLYASLGIGKAFLREFPQAIGAKNLDRVKRLQDVTFTCFFCIFPIIIIVIWILSYFILDDPTLRVGMRITAFLIIATQLYNLMLTVLRAKKQITVIGKLIILNTIFIAVFSLAGAYFFNVLGYVAGMVVSTLLSFYFARRYSSISFSFNIDWKMAAGLIRIGSVMLVASILFKTFLSIDKIMIVKMLGVEQLGLYTIGLMVINQIAFMPRFINIVMFPHIQERYGAAKKISEIKEMILRPTYLISRLAPIIIIGLIFVIEPLVHYFISQFKEGLSAMKILAFGYFFMITNEMSSTLLYTINKQNFLIPFYILLTFLNIGFNYLFIRLGWGIEGVALGTSIAYFCFFAIVFSFAIRHFMPWPKLLRLHMEIAAYYLYFLLNFLWIDRFVFIYQPLYTALLRIFCLGLISLPVLIETERREAVFSTAFRILKNKLMVRLA
ncbi:MAG: oligosaccharide flippase family protein [Candidatus Omnitrophota bacterium]